MYILKKIFPYNFFKKKISLYLILLMIGQQANLYAWGFFAHKKINRMAVFTLPPPMLIFYKKYIQYITENAVNPDKRRYAVKGEAPKHYIDMEHYQAHPNYQTHLSWTKAKKIYGEKNLKTHGIIPWHIIKMRYQLTKAFKKKQAYQILRLSADIGHYIADAHVPLHTTQNYNGQLTNQQGIHGLWETRLPELFIQEYSLWTGKASYIQNMQDTVWKTIVNTHQKVHSVLSLEKKLSKKFPPSKKYCVEQRKSSLFKNYSVAYAKAYHDLLDGQIAQQMRASIQMIGNFWFTCWVDAGQPNLKPLLDKPLKKNFLKENFNKKKKLKIRACEEHSH